MRFSSSINTVTTGGRFIIESSQETAYASYDKELFHILKHMRVKYILLF